MAFLAENRPLCGRITFAVGKLPAHVVDHFVRGFKAKGRRIADVQLQDLHPCVFHSFGFVYHRSPYVV